MAARIFIVMAGFLLLVALPATAQDVTVKVTPLTQSQCSGHFVPHLLSHITTVYQMPIRMYDSNGSGLALGDLGTRGLARAVGVGDLGARLRELGLQGLDVHACDHVGAGDEVAFVDQDLVHPPGRLGGDIDLGGLDAAVAAHEAAVVGQGWFGREVPGDSMNDPVG